MLAFLSSLSLKVADRMASTGAFLIALGIVCCWLFVGSRFDYSDRWMAVFNTIMSTITFLMVFLIQNAQNRNAKALHLKINELIRGVDGPRTEMVNVEQRTDEEIQKLDNEFSKVAEEASQEVADVAVGAAQRIEAAADRVTKRG
jgi:low affinity Fe/Cu permease